MSKNWTYYCFGINDFDHNVRIYGFDAHHPYQMWKFDPNQYILLPRCNNGDFPEEQVRCGDMVYLYQANQKAVSYVREVKGDDLNIGSYDKLEERKAQNARVLAELTGDALKEFNALTAAPVIKVTAPRRPRPNLPAGPIRKSGRVPGSTPMYSLEDAYAHEYLWCARGLVLTVAVPLGGLDDEDDGVPERIVRCRGLRPLARVGDFGPAYYRPLDSRVRWVAAGGR